MVERGVLMTGVWERTTGKADQLKGHVSNPGKKWRQLDWGGSIGNTDKIIVC